MKKVKIIILFLLTLFIVICAGFLVLQKYKFSYLPAYMPVLEKPHTQIINKSSHISDVFYGVSVDMSQLIPTSIHYIRNKDGEDLIDIAHRLGVNLFRITNVQKSFNGDKDSVYTKAQWNMVLNKMQSEGIKAIVLIESPTIYSQYIQPDYLPFVKRYIINSGVLDNPDVYAIDLKNEPAINNSNVASIKQAAGLIKSKYPAAKLTVGWWGIDSFSKDKDGKEKYIWTDYAAGRNFEDIIDFYSVHLYGFDSKVFGLYPDPYTFANIFISSVRAGLNTTKPILIEEFGAGNGDKITDQNTLGSKEIQASAYAGAYQSVEDNKISENLLGSIAYTFYPRDRNTDGWNILDKNGDYLYPAAYVLQKYATGKAH